MSVLGLTSEFQICMPNCPVHLDTVISTGQHKLHIPDRIPHLSPAQLIWVKKLSVVPFFSNSKTKPSANCVSFTFKIHPEFYHFHCFHSGLSHHHLPISPIPSTGNTEARDFVEIYSDHVTLLSKTSDGSHLIY